MEECIFCQVWAERSRVRLETEHFFVIFDDFPVNKGYMLIIPKRHMKDVFDLDGDEWADLAEAMHRAEAYLDCMFHPDGYNIGVNCGEAAGQTIFHLHIHVIPRYKGDVGNPRGGIRNFKNLIVNY